MGLGIMSHSKCSCSDSQKIVYRDRIVEKEVLKRLPNPDPNNYALIGLAQIGSYLIVQLRYPDSINFEGYKILLYDVDNSVIQKAIDAGRPLDPHFCNNPECLSPIARFEPTLRGIKMAQIVAYEMQNQPLNITIEEG